jgi:hypothetical protein
MEDDSLRLDERVTQLEVLAGGATNDGSLYSNLHRALCVMLHEAPFKTFAGTKSHMPNTES